MSENSDRSRTDVWGGGPSPNLLLQCPHPSGAVFPGYFRDGSLHGPGPKGLLQRGDRPPPKGSGRYGGAVFTSVQPIYKGGAHTRTDGIYK